MANTLQFSNKKHGAQLKFFKNQYKRANFQQDEPTLMYKGKPMKKAKALSEFFSKISGDKEDPNNPLIESINEMNKNLNMAPWTNGSMRALAVQEAVQDWY